jgi:hypothetical protein
MNWRKTGNSGLAYLKNPITEHSCLIRNRKLYYINFADVEANSALKQPVLLGL